MPPAEPPTPTHYEMRLLLREAVRGDDLEQALRYITAAKAKDARIAELEREVAELRAIRIPCDVCHREWCGGCTVQVGSPLRGQSMSLGDLVGEKKR